MTEIGTGDYKTNEEKLLASLSTDAASAASSTTINPYIYKLEHKPRAVLSHELGAGSPCLKCKGECSGLDLHYWRKICKNCYCRLDEHDIILPKDQDHGEFVIRKLFDKHSKEYTKYLSTSKNGLEIKRPKNSITNDFNNYENDENRESEFPTNGIVEKLKRIHLAATVPSPTQYEHPERNKSWFAQPASPSNSNNVSNERRSSVILSTERSIGDNYAWTPAGEHVLVERYMNCLPENERPIIGSQGAQTRRQRLAYQLPYHDCDASAAKSLKSETELQFHTKFVDFVKQNVVGIGKLVDSEMQRKQMDGKLNSENGRRFSFRKKHKFKCKTCTKTVDSSDVGIITDHGQSNEIWHPECFRCNACDQLLADLLYFFKDGKYFCGRHYGEQIYPRCSGCDELIFAKEYTFAEEKSWHVDHFCCFSCDLHLGGHRYITKEEKPYCIDCYMVKFARTCTSCKNKIAPFESRISHKDLHWHANDSCFKCKMCSKVLTNQKFSLREENTFCSPECTIQYYRKINQNL